MRFLVLCKQFVSTYWQRLGAIRSSSPMTARIVFHVLILSALYALPLWSDSRSPSGASTTMSDFVYLEEEAPLVPGRENRRIALYVSNDGITQSSEIADNELILFAEHDFNEEKEIFAVLGPLIARESYAVQKRSDSVSVVDGLYPAYRRIFYRARDKQAQLYGGLVSATPADVAKFVQRLRACCPAPVHSPKPPATRFLQAVLLDNETAAEFRRRRVLRVIVEKDLESAPLTAAALHHPFLLIPLLDGDSTTDPFVTQLTNRQPALDLEYGGVAVQLVCFKSRQRAP